MRTDHPSRIGFQSMMIINKKKKDETCLNNTTPTKERSGKNAFVAHLGRYPRHFSSSHDAARFSNIPTYGQLWRDLDIALVTEEPGRRRGGRDSCFRHFPKPFYVARKCTNTYACCFLSVLLWMLYFFFILMKNKIHFGVLWIRCLMEFDFMEFYSLMNARFLSYTQFQENFCFPSKIV